MIEKLKDVFNETIGVYLQTIRMDGTKLKEFINQLEPEIEKQLIRATMGDVLAKENLIHLEGQIAGKALEMGWALQEEEISGLQQIIITGVKVALTMLL